MLNTDYLSEVKYEVASVKDASNLTFGGRVFLYVWIALPDTRSSEFAAYSLSVARYF